MNDIAIKVEGLSKQYHIGASHERYRTFRDTLMNGITSPFRKTRDLIRGVHTGAAGLTETIWALRDVSFEVKRGDVVGIIGRNGAGKTTLLKILSRITEPTEGSAEILGRVGSLLEVGTGFHPELTGRENIYLNGAILGMKKVEIDKKFDEIVDFAEIEKFIDTPVKHYSSGMYVRLAFAVAAHLEPEILLVDEVLAVGDASFQKKCLGRMGDVAREGRAVLFVSHNMPAIARLCLRAIRLNSGRIVDAGPSHGVVEAYLTEKTDVHPQRVLHPSRSKVMSLRSVTILDHQGVLSGRVDMGKPFCICIEYDVNRVVTAAHVICFVYTSDGVNVLGTGDTDCSPERLDRREPGIYRSKFHVPPSLLGEGLYSLTVSLGVPYIDVYDRHENTISFEIFDSASQRGQYQHRRRPGILGLELPWTIEKLD
jgi:lipopolysaccharide transport system ATP-binding protein